MRSQFNSEHKILRYEGPLLQSHGTADEIVPLSLGFKLFAAAPGSPKAFLTIPGGGHNDPHTRVYYETVETFLEHISKLGDARVTGR